MSDVLAFDVGGSRLRSALVDDAGRVLRTLQVPTPRADAEGLRSALLEQSARLIDGAPGVAPVAVGLAVAGVLDTRVGVLRRSPNLRLEDEPLVEPLTRALGLPVTLINDVNAAALAEARERGCDDLVAVFLGTGVGTGVVCGGRPLLGHLGMAAEGGHLIHDPGGEPCPLGCVGCFEAHLGGASLGRAARAAGVGGSAAELLAAWRAGDQRARPAVERALDACAALFRLLVNAYDPAALVWGGGLARAFPEALAAATVGVAENPLGVGRRGIPLGPSGLGEAAGLLGAAWAARQGLAEGG